MAEQKKGSMLNASARDGVEYRKAPLWALIMSQANNGTGIAFYMMMTMVTYIGVQGYGIASVAVGVIAMCMRIFDGFTDALISAAFEKMNPKYPKIRIFVLGGWAIAALGIILMYNLAAGKFSGVAGMIIFIIIWVFYLMGYTINGMGGGVCGIVITNDPTQRPMMGLISTIFSYGVPLLGNNFITFFILPRHDNQYDVPMLGELCIFWAVVSLIFAIICCIGVKDVDNAEVFATAGGAGKSGGAVKWSDIVAVLTSNKNTQRYFWTCISDKFAQTMASYSVVTTMLSGVLIGSYAATTWVGNFSTPISFGFTFLGAMYVAKFGAKQSTVVWSWASIILKSIMVIYCLILGPQGMSKIGVFGPYLIFYGLLTMAVTAVSMILTVTGNTMRADVVDYELDRSGNYFPAVLAGVYNFVAKLTDSVTNVVVTACIALIGYVNTVPQKGDPAIWKVLIMTMIIANGLPIIGWIINLLAMKNYDLTKEEMVEIAKRNAARKEAMKAAAEAPKAEDAE